MLDWNAAKEAIRQAVVAATGVVDSSVTIDGTSESGTWLNYPLIELTFPNVKAWDDSEDYTEGEDGNLVTTLSGPREISTQVKITSDNADSEAAPTVIAEKLRTRLYRGSILGALRAAGIGVGVMNRTLATPYKAPNGRVYSAAIIEIAFNLAQNDVDETASPDSIERVTYTGYVPSFTVTVDKP